jgi:HPt (histidine-containing phosphotransfer) domain-containing protein
MADPAVDLDRAMKRVGDDRELLGELVEIFFRDLPDRLAVLREAVGRGRVSDVERVAHNMKGSLATLGAQGACELAGVLETACHEARLDSAPSLLEALESELRRVRAFYAASGWACA